MSDGASREPYLAPSHNKLDIMSEQDVNLILNKVGSLEAIFLCRHMMAAERRAFDAGFEAGLKSSTKQAWPVYVNADCEGKTSRIAAWLNSESAAVQWSNSDECKRTDYYGEAGRVSTPITIRGHE